MRDIGKNIRILRVKKGLAQDALADALFVTRQTVSNYETGRSRPDINMLMDIAAVLGTDANHILYGEPMPVSRKNAYCAFFAGSAILLILTIAAAVLHPMTKEMSTLSFFSAPNYLVNLTIDPAVMLVLGWCMLQGFGLLFGARPLAKAWGKYVRYGLLIFLAVVFLILCPFLLWLVSVSLHTLAGTAFDPSFPDVPVFQELLDAALNLNGKLPGLYLCFGGMLWIVGFPKSRGNDANVKQEALQTGAESDNPSAG